MTKWKLSKDGDDFERKYWPVIQPYFPNYEVFWSEFIVPMTYRNYLPKDHPFYIHPKKNVDVDLQNISMAHYTIFRCLLVANEFIQFKKSESTECIYADRLDLIYSNFGTVIDMVSSIFFFLAKLQVRFGIRKSIIRKKTLEELNQILEQFFRREYDTRIQAFEKTKRPVSINIHAMPDFIFDIIGVTSETKSFTTFSQRVRTIRNAAIHNPIIGTIHENQFPKLDKLKKYYFWGELFYNLDSNDFVDKEVMFVEDFKQLSMHLNSLWDELILKYREISEVSNFGQLLGTVSPFLTCPQCNSDMQYSEMKQNHFPTSYDKNKKEFILSSDSMNLFKTGYWNCQNCQYKKIISIEEITSEGTSRKGDVLGRGTLTR